MTIQADAPVMIVRCSDCRGILDPVFAGNLARRGLPVKHMLCGEGNPDLPADQRVPVTPTPARLGRKYSGRIEACGHSLSESRKCVHVKGKCQGL